MLCNGETPVLTGAIRAELRRCARSSAVAILALFKFWAYSSRFSAVRPYVIRCSDVRSSKPILAKPDSCEILIPSGSITVTVTST